MRYVYILSEDDSDDRFYKECLEKITGVSFRNDYRKLRKGGGIGEVRKKIRILLKSIQYTGQVDGVFFLIAIDNDRAPTHPDHNKLNGLSKKEQGRPCRFCELERAAEEILGKDRSKWPIQGAIAVPVQMIESWLLLICNSEKYEKEASLPIFAKKDSYSAKTYYKKQNIPDQLKDLCKKEEENLNLDGNFHDYCCQQLNPEQLEKISPSFAIFKNQVDTWKIPV